MTSDLGFTMKLTPDDGAVVMSSANGVSTLLMGNDLDGAYDVYGNNAGIFIRNNLVGIQTSNTSVDCPLTVSKGLRTTWQNGKDMHRLDSGNFQMFSDALEGVPRIVMSATGGLIHGNTAVFNTMKTLDVKGVQGMYAVCSVRSYERVDEFRVRIIVQNCMPVEIGDIILFNDVHIVLLVGMTPVSDTVNTVLFECFDVMVDDATFVQSLEGPFNAHTVFRMTDVEQRVMPKTLDIIRLESTVVQYSPDGTFEVTGFAETGKDFVVERLQLSNTHLGISHDNSNTSYIVVQATNVVQDAQNGKWIVTFSPLYDFFPQLPSDATTLYIYLQVAELIDDSPKYQVFPIGDLRVSVSDTDRMFLELGFDPEMPNEVLRRLTTASMLYIAGVRIDFPDVLTDEVDYDAKSVRMMVPPEADLLYIGNDIEVGVTSEFLGFPIRVIRQIELDVASGTVLWTFQNNVLSPMQLEQFDGNGAIVFDSSKTYVIKVLKVVAESAMVIRISTPWKTDTRTLPKLVYLMPVAAGYYFNFTRKIDVPAIGVADDVQCDKLVVTTKASFLDNITVGGARGSATFEIGRSRVDPNNLIFGGESVMCFVSALGGSNAPYAKFVMPVSVSSSNQNEAPEAPFHVRNKDVEGVSIKTDGSIFCVGGLHVPSDIRTKKRLKNIDSDAALKCLQRLRVAKYHSMTGRPEIGVIAQDLLQYEMTRKAVHRDTDRDMLSVRHDMLASLAIAAIKSLSQSLDRLCVGKRKRTRRTRVRS